MSRVTITMAPVDFGRRQAARPPYEAQPDDDQLITGRRAIAAFTGMSERAVAYSVASERLPGVVHLHRRLHLHKGAYRKAMHELAAA